VIKTAVSWLLSLLGMLFAVFIFWNMMCRKPEHEPPKRHHAEPAPIEWKTPLVSPKPKKF
jgi:hypothetical protein